MYKLLKINDVDFPEPYGSFTLSKSDKVNEYECEDGSSTIEIVRVGVVSLKVAYNALTVDKVRELCDAISTVSNVTVFDPQTNTIKSIKAHVSNIQTGKMYHKNDLSVWSLSFDINEL